MIPLAKVLLPEPAQNLLLGKVAPGASVLLTTSVPPPVRPLPRAGARGVLKEQRNSALPKLPVSQGSSGLLHHRPTLTVCNCTRWSQCVWGFLLLRALLHQFAECSDHLKTAQGMTKNQEDRHQASRVSAYCTQGKESPGHRGFAEPQNCPLSIKPRRSWFAAYLPVSPTELSVCLCSRYRSSS